MLGEHTGRPTSQGETVAGLLAEDGCAVRLTSSVPNPARRAAAIGRDLVRWRGDVDVVVVQVFSGRAFAHADLASSLARRLGLSVVLHLHGGNLPAFTRRWPRWVDRVLRRADRIVAPSEYLARTFRARGWTVVVVPNTLPVATYPHRHRSRVEPTLLWMRAFEPLYRPLLAVQAHELVCRRLPAATLTLAGPDGTELTAVRTLADRLGVADSLRLPGFLGDRAKRQALADHDIMLTTSEVDNTPVSVLEAAACGLPVVAAAVGGMADLLTHDHDGLLVASDPRSLADAVLRLVDEPALAATLSANGRRLAEGFDWPAVRPRWHALLAGLPRRG